MQQFPITYQLTDGTQVLVNKLEAQLYEFHLTRLNSEKYNFTFNYAGAGSGEVSEPYELRFNSLEQEALRLFLEKNLPNG